MLAKPAPTRLRQTVGGTLVVCAAAFVGVAAWAAQPPQAAEQPALQPGQSLEQSPLQPGQHIAQADAQPEAQGEQEIELVPLARIAPVYPQDAADRRATSECIVSFDVIDDGATRNVSAECTDPAFTASAVAAVEQWRYVKREDDDSDLARTDVRTMIRFEMAQ